MPRRNETIITLLNEAVDTLAQSKQAVSAAQSHHEPAHTVRPTARRH